ncbi:MAG: hypothetical protein JXX28_16165 [Deltaproteobacteria bacterium]|nr:hypothetical protein [Deltaproteobacteria bacterium]
MKVMLDYGHIDNDTLDQVLFGVSDLVGTEGGTIVDLALVREMSAATVFGPDGSALQEEGVLREDWPFLYS